MVDSPTFLALSETSISSRSMVYIEGLNALNEAVPFGFWTGTGDKSVDVVSGQTWSLVERDFAGNGRMLSFDNFGSVIGLESRSITVRLAGSDSLVEDMIRGYNLRRAPAQTSIVWYCQENVSLMNPLFPNISFHPSLHVSLQCFFP
jgi:hypothetical protein